MGGYTWNPGQTFHPRHEPTPDPQANSHAGQHRGFEVFWNDVVEDMSVGWYWWPCQPGCLPDAHDPNGPFNTSLEAHDDAVADGRDG